MTEKNTKSVLETIIGEPAVILEKVALDAGKIEKAIATEKPIRRAEEYWHTLGPGLVTGASDDDPSGIATYSQTGAQFGFQLLWLSWFTFPLMATIQEMCARVGLVTGKGLAANIQHHYSKKVLYITTTLLFAANTFNIGADLGAMAKGVQLLAPRISFPLLIVGFATVSLVLQIFTSYARYAQYLKYMAMVLFAYVFSALLSHLNWGELASRSFIPSIHFTKDQIYLVCAILGTTISPYLFFWQTSQEVEERKLHGEAHGNSWHQNPSKAEMRRLKIDVWSGMFFSNSIMFFIIAACAGTLFTHGITNITSAADAAMALRPLAGDAAYFLFAVGIIGTGMLAIPVLAGSTSYAVSESFGWKEGLYRKLKEAYAFYGVIIISMGVGIVLNFLHFDPIKVLIYSAVANGIIAPVILVLIVRLSSNKKVMGEYANNPRVTWVGWLTVAIMCVAGVAAIVSLFY
jgi:NRAMP (natural resistance-associated macrophage protein)-like metal ion transporter